MNLPSIPKLSTNYPKFGLRGAVVVITGGARGIGYATAQAFAKQGARVVIGDLDGDAAKEAARNLGALSMGLPLDVTDKDSFAAFVQKILRSGPGIDVLVNNAGIMPLGGFLDEPDGLSRATMDVNVFGLINGMRLVLPHMVERGHGHIVNVASMAGKLAVPGMAVYNASKFAAVGLTASVRQEFEPAGVSVSAVLPSAVRTRLSSGVPLGHGMPTVDPEDVAKAIVASVDTRAAEIPVPGYLAGWDLVNAVTPEPIMKLGRRILGDRRALTSIDHAVRGAYDAAVNSQTRQ
ncbi:SDR family oxidoreductase [Smaragdicoccus niigatensis]|uniref:SDR family oxidoreductase n=1 Tax=Smaragdicoccus niigatensis TaxID=359359 RepID=UPI00037C6F71|nr:SDR family oxidoreductase [Smaragdicoccus niigatensis]